MLGDALTRAAPTELAVEAVAATPAAAVVTALLVRAIGNTLAQSFGGANLLSAAVTATPAAAVVTTIFVEAAGSLVAAGTGETDLGCSAWKSVRQRRPPALGNGRLAFFAGVLRVLRP